MELFKVEYEGQQMVVRKSERGSIYVPLPARYGNRGSAFRESITHEERGWRFTSTQDDDIEYYFHMWLKPDGRMAWANDMTYGIEEFSQPFNPVYPNAGVLNDTASKLYSIVKQIEAYQNRNLPTTELFLLRQYYLTTSLKMLGYDSVDDVIENSNVSRDYLGLNVIASQLEDYRSLSGLVVSAGNLSGEEAFLCIAPENIDRKKALELAKPVKEQIEDNIQFMQEQDSSLAQKRTILPGYRTKMSEKVGVYSCDNYERAVRNAALLLLELNSDLLTPEQRERIGVEQFSCVEELALKDKISELIDSRDFNEACKVESRFAYDESIELIRRAKEVVAPRDTVQDMTKIIDEERKHSNDRKRSLDNHEKYNFKKKRKSKGYSLDDE